MVAARCNCSVVLDIPPIWGERETRIRDGDLTLEQFIGEFPWYFSKQIVKEPCLTFMFSEAREAFPHHRHVNVVRDPRDNIRSILNRIDIPGDLERTPADILTRVPVGWNTVVDPLWNRCVTDSHYIDVQAHRWNEAVACQQESATPPLVIRYEDFNHDKIAAIDDLARQCGLEPKHDISRLLDRQFQPQGDREVTWEEFFGKTNLDRIETICRASMSLMRYA